MKKLFSCLLFAGFLWSIPGFGYAAEIGSTSDIKFSVQAAGKDAWSQIYVVAVLYPQLPYSIRSGAVLSKLKQEYLSKNVRFFGIVPTGSEQLEKFIQAHPELDFPLCPDPELIELRKILNNKNESFSPVSILNYSGKLLWSGEAVDLPMMLKIITGGRYSERDEIRMAVLSNSLQAALRSGNAKLIEEAADQILLLRPEQLSAVNAKAYALEISGNIDRLERFFRERIQRFPQAAENYFMLIEAAFRLSALNHIAPEIAQVYIKSFPSDTDNINAIAWSLLNDMPLNIQALKTAIQAVNILEQSPAANQSRILATRALLAYRQCKLKAAIELAQSARKQANTEQEKAFLANMAEYFRQIAE